MLKVRGWANFTTSLRHHSSDSWHIGKSYNIMTGSIFDRECITINVLRSGTVLPEARWMSPESGQDLYTRHGAQSRTTTLIHLSRYILLLASKIWTRNRNVPHTLLRRKLHLDIRRLLIIHRFSSGDEDLSNLLYNCSATGAGEEITWGGVINSSTQTFPSLFSPHSSTSLQYSARCDDVNTHVEIAFFYFSTSWWWVSIYNTQHLITGTYNVGTTKHAIFWLIFSLHQTKYKCSHNTILFAMMIFHINKQKQILSIDRCSEYSIVECVNSAWDSTGTFYLQRK